MELGPTIRSAWSGVTGLARFLSVRIRRARWSDWVAWGLILTAVVVLLPAIMSLAMAGIVAAMAFFWVGEFVRLMRTPESEFPGKHDRILWILTLLFLLPVGALAFWTYRKTKDEPYEPSRAKPRSPWLDSDLM